MGQQTHASKKSFIEVLESQMRLEIRAELEREYTRKQAAETVDLSEARAGQFESWLASHVEKSIFSGKQSVKRAYGAPPPKAQKPAPKRQLVLEEILALELLKRHSGINLDENFTELDLKGAWRKAALKSHPDHVDATDLVALTRATALFRELTAAYEILQTPLKNPAQAAA